MVSPAEKTTQPSTVAHQKAQQQPFFRKAEEGSFFNGGSIQPKLNIGQREDKFEQHADAMANKVVSKSATNTPAIQAKPDDKNSEEKLDKKEEEQKSEVGALQRKEMFESEGEPDVQRSIYPENDEGEKVFRTESDAQSGSIGKGEAIVSIARSKLGKVRAKEGLPGEGGKQLRFGYETLLEIFHLAAPGVWSDDVIKNQGDGLPSWCGIFAVYCIKKSGIDIGTWQMGKGVSAFGKLKQTGSPQAGDIGYMDAHQHHAIVVKVDGDIVHSIDGNSGLKSEIIENQRPKKAYRGFFTALQNDVTTGGDVQKKENAGNSNEASPSIEGRINSSKGGGSQLDSSTRSEMESGFGNDFSDVRVHTGSEAQQMSKDLNAQAFTHGQDIYFDQGKYNPQTSSGKHLLAHELTHTVQQTGGLQKMVQKDGNVPAAKTNAKPAIISPNTITIEESLAIPKFKDRNKSKYNTPLIIPKNFDRETAIVATAQDKSKPSAQSEIWKNSLEKNVKVEIAKLSAECKEKKNEKPFPHDDTTKVIYLTNNNIDLIGTEQQLGETLTIPVWTASGKGSAFDVDHIREMQLGGENKIDNMELLHTSANRSSGSVIRRQIADRIKDGLEAAKSGEAAGSTIKIPSITEAKTNYDIVFNSLTFTDTFTVSGETRKYPKQEIGADTYWSKEVIEKGDHLKDFKPMGPDKMKKIKDNKDPIIYTSEIGGHGLSKNDIANFSGFSNVSIGTVSNNPLVFGTLNFNFKPKSTVINKEFSVKADIYTMPGIPNGGYIPRKSEGGKKGIEGIIGMMEVDGLSPASIITAEMVPGIGLVIKGKIHPSIEIIKGFDLDFFIEGDNFGISKTISAGEIKVPPPFKINDAFITIGAGTNGIFVEGDVLFEINKVGTGKISGLGKSNGDFGISGTFDFDPKLFKGKVEKAGVKAAYNNKDGWKIEGDLTFAENAVKGIKSGNIHVEYANEILKAEGTAETTIKGVKEVTLKIVFGKDEFEIEGGVKIEKLPGIKEGDGTLKVVKKDNEYDFSGSGKITPDIPGLTTQLAFEFHNDIFLVDAKVDFEKGRLKGMLNVGITNREVDAEGKPTGKALPDYKVYGESTLALKITDNITVTAGVKLLENGQIEVRGGIKLPQRFQVVPKLFSVVEKPLLTIPPIHIPLFGIPLGVATIGIEAVIKPRLTADVQIGPGDLTNVQAEIVYNPSLPDEMTITGGADFEFIAEAGITAGVDFGISASIAIASLTGGINLSAYIKAAAQQPVFHADIKYSPKTGFELNGDVKALVKAILGFKGDFYAEASIGIWPADYTKRWEWPIFKKEIDTGLQIGFEFPFSYKDGKANASFENLKFSYPTMGDLTTKVKEQIVNPIADKF